MATDNYVPFGPEWEKEMSKHPKITLIKWFAESAQLLAEKDNEIEKLKAGAIWQEQQGWVRVEDVPIVVKVDGRLGINRLVPEEFLAALEVHDSESKETYWWMRHCRINEQGDLRVITDDDDDYCGWAVTDITHWRGLTPPGTVFPASPPGSTPVESKEGKYRKALELALRTFYENGESHIVAAKMHDIISEALKP